MEKGWGTRKLDISPNLLQVRWAIILVTAVSLQVASLFWEGTAAPAYNGGCTLSIPISHCSILPAWEGLHYWQFSTWLLDSTRAMGHDQGLNPILPSLHIYMQAILFPQIRKTLKNMASIIIKVSFPDKSLISKARASDITDISRFPRMYLKSKSIFWTYLTFHGKINL